MPNTHSSFLGEVRIIGGDLKRSKLQVANKKGLRPTPDRVRETLFNWLGQNLAGWQVVDAFAGTGVLGLEAASRGAASVTLIEKDRDLVRQIERNWARLQSSCRHPVDVRAYCADFFKVQSIIVTRASLGVDLVFLDPPYALDAVTHVNGTICALELAQSLIKNGGYLYFEGPSLLRAEHFTSYNLDLMYTLKAGAVHAHLLKKNQTLKHD